MRAHHRRAATFAAPAKRAGGRRRSPKSNVLSQRR
jgi:hypothetical protein